MRERDEEEENEFNSLEELININRTLRPKRKRSMRKYGEGLTWLEESTVFRKGLMIIVENNYYIKCTHRTLVPLENFKLIKLTQPNMVCQKLFHF